MSRVSVWNLFAYMGDDEKGAQDERRRLSEWQVQDTLRWCLARGYDHIYLSRDPIETARFERGTPVPVRHHMHVVEGSTSEPGDEAA